MWEDFRLPRHDPRFHVEWLFMTRDLQGRRILITGASSGIGKALAQQLGGLGAKLVLAARSEDKLKALARYPAPSRSPRTSRQKPIGNHGA